MATELIPKKRQTEEMLVPKKRTCNRHEDCDEADRKAKAAGSQIGCAEHCRDNCCEDCFGN